MAETPRPKKAQMFTIWNLYRNSLQVLIPDALHVPSQSEHNPRGADCYDLHFTDKGAEAQSPSCQSHCLMVVECRLEPRQPDTCLRLTHSPRPVRLRADVYHVPQAVAPSHSPAYRPSWLSLCLTGMTRGPGQLIGHCDPQILS